MNSALVVFVFLSLAIHIHPQTSSTQTAPGKQSPEPATKSKLPDFSENPAVADFISQMVVKHEFEAELLADYFSKIAPNERVLDLMDQSAPSQTQAGNVVRSWRTYRGRFLTRARIDGGVAFWKKNKEPLARAYDQFGVPPEIIVAIIGVETMYGRYAGTHSILEALASLGFHDTRRADYFREELEHFLLLTRESKIDPLKPIGSYAGAIGIPQFMPGSWRRYAVDFDGDGIIDLENSVADSIGSVANYLKEHGWQKDEPIVHKISLVGKPLDSWLEAGMMPSLQVGELALKGVKGAPSSPEVATFISLPTPGQPTEYWLGYQNYYAITRYNRSTFYSMSVFQLAKEIKSQINQ